jgi:hypothetical protein
MACFLNGCSFFIGSIGEKAFDFLQPSFYFERMQELGSFTLFMVLMTLFCLGLMCWNEINSGRDR